MCDPHTIGLNSPASVTSGVTSASHAGTVDAAPSITAQNHKPPLNADISNTSSDSATTQTSAFAASRSYRKRKEKLTVDCSSLSDAELRKLYWAEHTSWRGIFRRERDGLCSVAEEFRDFRCFLRELGPRPKKGFTVDRIDNDNKTYGPSLVRWADKKTQNNNKSDTNIFIDPKTGKKYTTSDLMKKHGRSSAVIRKRKERGWTDADQIAGRKLPSAPSKPDQKGLSNLVELEDTWFHELDAYFERNGSRAPFVPSINGKDRGMLKAIRERTPLSDTAAVIRFAVRHWVGFARKVENAAGLRTTPLEPRLEFLARYPDIAARFYLDHTTAEEREELRLPSPCRSERARAAAEAEKVVKLIARPAVQSPDPKDLRKRAYEQTVADRGGVAPLDTYDECLQTVAEILEIAPCSITRQAVLGQLKLRWDQIKYDVQLEHLTEQQRADYAEVDPDWFRAKPLEIEKYTERLSNARDVQPASRGELAELL